MEQKTYIKNHPRCIEEKAKKHYGLTDTFEFAGYMLEDGTMLNFSHDDNQRDIDHRNIGFFYKDDLYTGAMLKFMRRGNIRVGCNQAGYIFQALKIPTESQIKTLLDANKIANKHNIPFRFQYKNQIFFDMTGYFMKQKQNY